MDLSTKNYQTTNEVRIENSTYCNYKCDFCPYPTDLFYRKKDIMSNELFESLVLKIKDQAPQITKLTISGLGEPFVDKNIYDKLKFAKSMGYTTIVLSNGSILHTNKFIEDHLDIIRLSLHTLNPEKYKKITGGNLDTLKKNIDFLKNTKVQVCLTCVMEEQEEGDVENILKTYESEVDSIEIWKPHNWAVLYNYRATGRIANTCGRPFHGPLQVDVNGHVKLCCFDTNGELYIGDFKKDTLHDIYEGETYKSIVESHKTGNLQGLICETCDQLMDKKDILIYSTRNSEDRLNLTSSTLDKFV